jgi:hypothetical protein
MRAEGIYLLFDKHEIVEPKAPTSHSASHDEHLFSVSFVLCP